MRTREEKPALHSKTEQIHLTEQHQAFQNMHKYERYSAYDILRITHCSLVHCALYSKIRRFAWDEGSSKLCELLELDSGPPTKSETLLGGSSLVGAAKEPQFCGERVNFLGKTSRSETFLSFPETSPLEREGAI
jgi:hypothetical protein